MNLNFLILFFILLFFRHSFAVIEHSFQVQNHSPESHHDHHIDTKPIHSSDSEEDEHDISEIIEVPDSVTELALKAKSYADAEIFAKKFNFKNLGRVSFVKMVDILAIIN